MTHQEFINHFYYKTASIDVDIFKAESMLAKYKKIPSSYKFYDEYKLYIWSVFLFLGVTFLAVFPLWTSLPAIGISFLFINIYKYLSYKDIKYYALENEDFFKDMLKFRVLKIKENS